MKKHPKSFKKLNLLIFFGILIFCASCSNDDGPIPSEKEIGEVKLSAISTDTIVYALVDNVKVPIYLSIPKECAENAPFPAVVILHGSDGMWKDHDPNTRTMSGQNNEWRQLFDQNCMVGAYVDSYSGRGVSTRTGKWATAPDNFKISSQFVRNKDANAALALLQKLKFNDGRPVVRPRDIGLLGFSDGASAVAATLYDTDKTPDNWKWTQSFDGTQYDSSSGVMSPEPKPEPGYAGGIFYYGGSGGYNYWGASPCGSNALEGNIYSTYAPILYQIPEEGYLTENTLCLIQVLKEKGGAVELNFYKGVGHGFDFDHIEQSYLARENSINWFKKVLNMN